MDVDTFLARLTKHRYFEGYTEEAVSKATRDIRKNYADGLAGGERAAFERFPGLALVVTSIDLEMSGDDDLKLVLRQLGNASFGMFAPRSIQVTRHANGEVSGLRFNLNGVKHQWSIDYDSWIPEAFFEEVEKITKQECSGLVFQAVEYPDPGQSAFFLWCTPRAFKALERAKLIPSPAHPLSGEPPAESTKDDSDKKEKEITRELTARFAPPQNTGRVDRLGVFRQGKWRLPSHSVKNLLAWQEIAAVDIHSAVGFPLRKQISQSFDLLCARDLGMTELGSRAHYARQVVALTEYYFFGAWREGHVEDGKVLTAADALKELTWDDELRMGCAAAVAIDDFDSLGRMLQYPCHDVYDQYCVHELSYHRLLSDLVRERQDWDWPAQLDIVSKSYDPRLGQLASCLAALRQNDAAAFMKAVQKFAKKPAFVPPFSFTGAIDWDVTTLCGLARRKSWPCDFPERLQDKILDPRLISA